jgi:TRAP-type C4-dicarboxylate transport system permease small subunit
MSRVLHSLVRLRAALDRAEAMLLLVLLVLLMVLSFLQVVLRQFQGGLDWGEVLIRHFVLCIGMVGAGLAAARSRHIRIDALGRLLSPTVGRWTGMVLDGLSAWICARLALAARDFVGQTREFGDLLDPLAWPDWSVLGALAGQPWPAWPLQAVIPAGFFLMAFHFALNMPLRWVDPPGAEAGDGEPVEAPVAGKAA